MNSIRWKNMFWAVSFMPIMGLITLPIIGCAQAIKADIPVNSEYSSVTKKVVIVAENKNQLIDIPSKYKWKIRNLATNKNISEWKFKYNDLRIMFEFYDATIEKDIPRYELKYLDKGHGWNTFIFDNNFVNSFVIKADLVSTEKTKNEIKIRIRGENLLPAKNLWRISTNKSKNIYIKSVSFVNDSNNELVITIDKTTTFKNDNVYHLHYLNKLLVSNIVINSDVNDKNETDSELEQQDLLIKNIARKLGLDENTNFSTLNSAELSKKVDGLVVTILSGSSQDNGNLKLKLVGNFENKQLNEIIEINHFKKITLFSKLNRVVEILLNKKDNIKTNTSYEEIKKMENNIENFYVETVSGKDSRVNLAYFLKNKIIDLTNVKEIDGRTFFYFSKYNYVYDENFERWVKSETKKIYSVKTSFISYLKS